MKKLIIACAGLIVAGFASASQLDEVTAKIQALEERLARIEGDLYKAEVKSVAPAKKVEKHVVDAKIDAFLKEYLGVQFGDSIDKFPEVKDIFPKPAFPKEPEEGEEYRTIPVLKKFKDLDVARGHFCYGKLYSVEFFIRMRSVHIQDSDKENMEQLFSDLAVYLGLERIIRGLDDIEEQKKHDQDSVNDKMEQLFSRRVPRSPIGRIIQMDKKILDDQDYQEEPSTYKLRSYIVHLPLHWKCGVMIFDEQTYDSQIAAKGRTLQSVAAHFRTLRRAEAPAQTEPAPESTEQPKENKGAAQ